MRETAPVSVESGPKTPEAILTQGLERVPEELDKGTITVEIPPELASVPKDEQPKIIENLRRGLQRIGMLTAFAAVMNAVAANAGWARETGYRVNEFSPVPTPEQVQAKEQPGMKTREHSFNKGATTIIIEGPKANLPDAMPKILKLLTPSATAGEEPDSPFLAADDSTTGDVRTVTYKTKENKPTEVAGTVFIPYIQTKTASGSMRLMSDDELAPLGRPATAAGGEAPWGEGTSLPGRVFGEQRVQIPVTEDKKVAVTIGLAGRQAGKEEGRVTPRIGVSFTPDEFTEFNAGVLPAVNPMRAEIDIGGMQKPLGLEGSATHRTDTAKGWIEYGAQVQARIAGDKITTFFTDPKSTFAGARTRFSADKHLGSWGAGSFFAGAAEQSQYVPTAEGRPILHQVGGRVGVLIKTPPEWKESDNFFLKLLSGELKVTATLYGALPKDPTGPAFALEVETREQPPEKKAEKK